MYFLQCFFHLEVPQLAPSCPSVDPRSVSVPATKTQQAYVHIVHQQSRSEQIWQLSEILKRSIWKTMKNLKRSWKTEILSKISAQPPAQPCLPSPHCSPLRHAAGRTWNSKVNTACNRNADATRERTMRTACRAQHFSVTQPRPSMRHSLGNQSTQFWGSGLDVFQSNKLRNFGLI